MPAKPRSGNVNRPALLVAGLVILVSCAPGGAAFRSETNIENTPAITRTINSVVSTPMPQSTIPDVKSTQVPKLETVSPTQVIGIRPEEAAKMIPLAPSLVKVEIHIENVVLIWRGTGEDIVRYEVYRKLANGLDWEQMTSVEINGNNREFYDWKDNSTNPGVTYVYGVQAVSVFEAKSTIAESPEISVP